MSDFIKISYFCSSFSSQWNLGMQKSYWRMLKMKLKKRNILLILLMNQLIKKRLWVHQFLFFQIFIFICNKKYVLVYPLYSAYLRSLFSFLFLLIIIIRAIIFSLSHARMYTHTCLLTVLNNLKYLILHALLCKRYVWTAIYFKLKWNIDFWEA